MLKRPQPRPPDEPWTIRAQDIPCFTDITSAEDFGDLVWTTGVQRQAEHARELVFLGDGACWIWDRLKYRKCTEDSVNHNIWDFQS